MGIRDMKKALIPLSIQPVEKRWVIASITYLLTICQQLVKKTPENPSGPKELLLFSWKTADLISSGVRTTTRN